MRKSTLAFVCAVFSACAWGDGSGTNTPPPVDGSSQQAVCGDGTCAATEVGNCPSDCGMHTGPVCPNGTCEAGETNATCPADCPPAAAMCGDGTCNGTEDSTTCPGDCPVMGIDCMDPNTLLMCFPCIVDPNQCTPDCLMCFPP